MALAKKNGTTYGRPSERFAEGPGVLADPADRISPAECRDNADLSTRPEGWIKNRFAYCHIGTFMSVLRRCVGVVCFQTGLFQARITLIGEAYNGTRAVDYRALLDQITVSGLGWGGEFTYRIDCAGSPGASSCLPNTESTTQTPIGWIVNPEAEMSFHSDGLVPAPENGEQLTRGLFVGTGVFAFPNRAPTEASSPETSVRFDSAWYLTAPEGSIFDRTVPWMSYRKSDADVDETATHIEDAQLRPELTVPVVPDKHVPGASENDTLTRLYHDDVRRNANRAGYAIPVCRVTWPNYPDQGQDCDEYPFSSTYEGAARHDYEDVPYGMFSARALGRADNQEAGSRLGVFLGYDRIIDGDEFFVRIVP